jgi:Na+-transporting methylmalonyl-CoA/oxaloacetate decarboxylase gamma subunit
MKAFYVVLLLVFITSCASNAIVEEAPEEVTLQTTQELEAAIQELPEEIIEELSG